MNKKTHQLQQRLANELAQSVPPTECYTRVKHSVNLGDLYCAMGAIKKYYDVTGRKVIVSQQINLPAAYYSTAVHPTLHEGVMVTMNQNMWDMVKPLIESQEYIHSFEKYEGQKIDLDFDIIRGKTFVNMPHGSLAAWIPYAYPDLDFDLSKAWIILGGKIPVKIKKQVHDKIIINFTERYRNNLIDYFFLKNYAPNLIFSGTEREHWLFCNHWQLTIPRLEIDNFLELGYALKASRFLLSNQSQCWNLADAIKTPRILEVCQFAQNCQPMIGEDSKGFFHQVAVEYYFRTLFNKTNR